VETALGIVMGTVTAVTVLVIGILRYGILFPRIGRWLDARIYAAFPRAGHLFTDEDATPEGEGEQSPDVAGVGRRRAASAVAPVLVAEVAEPVGGEEQQNDEGDASDDSDHGRTLPDKPGRVKGRPPPRRSARRGRRRRRRLT
jgi:hypothetical protein